MHSDFEWLHDLLQTLGRGQIANFNSAVQKHNQVIQRFPHIMRQLDYLRQKVAIIAFLEYVFQIGKDERNIPFSAIKDVCQVELYDVELLLMKAMSLDLVRGSIDEHTQCVEISWIQPRYLNKDHLRVLVEKMKAWENKVEQMVFQIEGQAEELLAK